MVWSISRKFGSFLALSRNGICLLVSISIRLQFKITKSVDFNN